MRLTIPCRLVPRVIHTGLFILTLARRSVSPRARPKRLLMAPRTVLGQGYSLHGMVLGLPGGGRGEHRRLLPHASWSLSRHASHGHSTLQQAIVALAALRFSESFPPQAVQRAWTTRRDRALLSRREQGESRAAVAGPCQTRALWGMSYGGEARLSAKRVVLWHVRPLT